MAFVKATKAQAKLRMAITGPSGAGKTKTALRVADGIGGPVALVDSEYKSASKYASEHSFDVDELSGETNPLRYIKAIEDAEAGGYSVLILDSLTHAWEATKAVVDKRKAADKFQNGFSAWAEGSALWQKLLDKIQSSKLHVIVTMRAKTEYVQEKDDRGKSVVRKLGMAPEVRDGTEYAFDAVLDMDHAHQGRVTKTRCSALDDYFEVKPGEDLGRTLAAWLCDGAPAPAPRVELADQKRVEALMARLAELDAPEDAIAEVMGATRCDEMTADQFGKLAALWKALDAEAKAKAAAATTTTEEEGSQE